MATAVAQSTFDRLRDAGQAYVNADEELKRQRLIRDGIIREAVEMGYTVREIADAVYLTTGRVSQIANE